MGETSNNFLNDINDYSLASSGGLAGGNSQVCENISEILSRKHFERKTLNGSIMKEDLRSVINKSNRLNWPEKLDPATSTFLDVAVVAFFDQRLSYSTISKHLRYARFMQNHIVPVDFKNLNYENFKRHMLHREIIENASPHALTHEWRSIKMFLDAYGISLWPYKPPSKPKHKKRNLPMPNTVRDFFYYKYSKNPFENALYQYIYQLGFLVGWRAPSEICEMKTTDIDLDSGTVIITETKKHKSERTIIPEPFILTSKSHKSFYNWLNVWRPKAANELSGNALFIQPNGRPFTPNFLRMKLSRYGKQIWPSFSPYDMRHWCAIARLIETKIDTGNYDKFFVQSWLGHENEKTTKTYLGHAVQYYKRHSKSWIKEVLRSRVNKQRKGKPQDLTKNRVNNLLNTLLIFSPVKACGFGRAHLNQQKELCGEFALFSKLCLTVKSITLKFSTFFILLSILDKWGALHKYFNARFPSLKPPHSSQIYYYLRIFIEVFNIEINRAGGV